jgi:hypothetical protein
VFIVIHPNQRYAVEADPSFEAAITYSEFIPLLNGEIGRLQCIPFGWVRVILSSYPAASAVGN